VRLRALAPTAAPSRFRDIALGLAGGLRHTNALARLARDTEATLGVRAFFPFSSGRAALVVALAALRRLSSATRVVVPAYTCFSVPAAVKRAGLDLVPCDVDPCTLDYDFDQLERLLASTAILCVLSTHLFGLPADLRRVRRLCADRGIFVLEDAAQAFGLRCADGWLGTLGDVSLFSFGRGKTVSAAGGGAAVTNSSPIAESLAAEYAKVPPASSRTGATRLAEAVVLTTLVRPRLYWLPERLPLLGLGRTEYSTDFGIRRLSNVQAGLLLEWHQQAERFGRLRTANAHRLAELLPEAVPLLRGPCIRMPYLCASRSERDAVLAASRQRGLGIALMYPTSIHRIPELRREIGHLHLPGADHLADRLLTLPVHCHVSDRDLVEIARVVRAGTRS
jgi:perosamine synthetase